MPELPEVEVTRRSVVKNITGARIESLRLGKPLRWPLGIDPLELAGQTVLGVRRRGKYLLVDLDDGLLLLHLGMSGSLAFWPTRTDPPPPPPPGPHDHFDLWTDRGLLRLHDPRRFGAAVWARHEQDPVAEKLLGHLGVEPLGPDFKPDAFHAGLKTRSAPIKQVLLAGELVVGVGNIYASETLFLAGIRPSTRAQKISRPRADRLFAAIIQATFRCMPMFMAEPVNPAGFVRPPFAGFCKASVPAIFAPNAKNPDALKRLAPGLFCSHRRLADDPWAAGFALAKQPQPLCGLAV